MTEVNVDKGQTAGAIASASTGVAAAALTVVSAACCVSPVLAPIVVSVLGASGAVWAVGLKPYGWLILGTALACLAFGFWTVYRSRQSCAIDDLPRSARVIQNVTKVCLWLGAACWMAGVVLKVLLP